MHDDQFSEQPINPYAAPQASKPSFEERLELRAGSPARVRFGAIGEAWEFASERRGTWALMCLVLLGTSVAITMMSVIAQAAVEGGVPRNGQSSGAGILVSLAFSVLSWAVQSFQMAGMFRAACKQVRGEPIQASDIFGAPEATWPYMLAGLLVGCFITLGMLLLIIPGIIIAGRLMLVFPLIADGRLSATEALGTSWRALRGQSLKAFVFQLVAVIVASLGVLLCCVGILLTYPIYFLSVAIVYRDYFHVKAKDTVVTEWPELA